MKKSEAVQEANQIAKETITEVAVAAGKAVVSTVTDTVNAVGQVAKGVGTVALAVGTGGSSLAALSVAGTAFTVAKGTAIAEMVIGGAEVVVAMTGDLDYAMEGATEIVAGLMKNATANKGATKVGTAKDALAEQQK